MLTQSTNIEAQFSKPYPAPARIEMPYSAYLFRGEIFLHWAADEW